MIIKNHEKSIRLLITEALQRRLPPWHPKLAEIKEDWNKQMAGYRGEQALDYHLSILDSDEFYILYDLRLPCGDYYFQIDTLLIHPSFILIIEVKNMKGSLLFHTSFNQLIRTLNDQEEGFKNPIAQVKRQTLQLQKWLNNHHISLPIYSVVVISNPNGIIKADQTANIHQLRKQVIHLESLTEHIYTLANKTNSNATDKKSLKRLCKQLLKSHTPLETNIELLYQLTPDLILNGVQCPQCSSAPMKRINANWFCPSCKLTSKQAHIQAIQDYFLLVSPTITTREAAIFLQVSTVLACKLLKGMNLHSTGRTKNFVFLSPFYKK
ncbi:nuclease-related domain-containing protein [Bacillus salitolerans]|uniref:Nuclease-related domain-containing protein n=1 Tax=Bacillus salitolerans TaxID=1437434 RepID=A0ABW4LU58_9BACI